MQVLTFVNTSGSEPWKTRDAKRFVRSHAMKDFRRKQREQKKRRIGDHGQPGESSFTVACLLPDQENAQDHALSAAPKSSDIPSPASSVEKYSGKKDSLPRVSQCLHGFLGRAATSPATCSILPQIFPLQDTLDARLPSPSPSISSDSPSSSSFAIRSVNLSPSQDFDVSVCMTVYGALDAAGANFDLFTKHYFRSVHSYLTIIHRNRFIRSVHGLSKKARAEVALLLLCMRLCAEPTKSGIGARGGDMYRTAKKLFGSIHTNKGASVELVQAGALVALFEHNADLRDTDYETLQGCGKMALALGLDALPVETNTVDDEERRRAYWGLLSLDCIISLHDEKHERPLVFPVPSPDDVLPSISDADYENAVDDMPVASTSFIVQSRLPTWADSFSRQGQSVRLMYMVQKILREKFDTSPDLMISRIEHLDNLIVSTLGSLLQDCHGKATQYCGPISCCMSASYLIHEYQLLSTIHSPSQKASDTQAPKRSQLAIETMIEMMVNILREFPVSHTPELSPTALFCPYQAAMLGLLLDRINGLRRLPTLAGATFDMMIGGLKHFSTVWPCTAEYIKNIRRAQSRALPMPLPCAA